VAIKRISQSEIRKAAGLHEAVPAGIPPVLKNSWKFARGMAQRFSRELIKDRADKFLKTLAKRFT
jgi:hypothetical protein